MAKLIEEETSRFLDPETLEAQVSEYAKLKASMEVLEARSKQLREKLFEHLDTEGFEDEKGNIQLDLPSPIDGVLRIEKQRRATRKLDEVTAETLIEEIGLADEVYEMKRVINEDALMAAFYEGKITEQQLDDMFPVSVIWALRTVKK
ncbi:hypothetical protein UFOVP111_57 [uncultured Caudovirales phage]|uniref:Uncharacterized protein n=1 Tax=uncultured Caudovirales phage TaxID=2100421 RepID=A0A6J5L295_9CAUD|nr:hypothetical protein UFOVP111_57 [uncultured Caudovirales phage]